MCSTYVGTAAAVAGVVAVDVAGEVGEGEVLELHAGVVRSFSRAGITLVDVGLGDEDWEGDVVDAYVAPGDVGQWCASWCRAVGCSGVICWQSSTFRCGASKKSKLTTNLLVDILVSALQYSTLTHVTFSTSPCPPTQDLRRAAYKPPATVIRSKWMFETLANLPWLFPREPIDRPVEIVNDSPSSFVKIATYHASDSQSYYQTRTSCALRR